MISGVVYSALASLVSNRCYPNTFEQEPRVQTWPAIRFQLLDANPTPDICGTDDGATDDTRVQVDAVALTYGGAASLRDQIINAMMNTDPPCIRDRMFEAFDPETKTHRVSIDFIFAASSEA